MNLLCVTPLFPTVEKPFYCVYLLQQLQAIERNGVTVTVLVPTKSDAFSIIEEEFGGLRVIRLNYKKIDDGFKSFVIQNIADNGYNIIALNLCSLDLIEWFAASKIQPVVIHFHGLNVWENYYEVHPLYAKILKLKKIAIYRKADAIIGVSKKVSTIASRYYPAKKTYTVYNGVNPELFHPCSSRKTKHSFDIYCVANLIQIKGHKYLITAVATARSQVSDKSIKLHIIGNGPLKDNLVELSKSLDMSDSVFFEGELPYDVVAERMRDDCDMFIMPSFFESLGCVYLEAMACEVPTVGVRGCGIDEVIIDGVNGFLVDPQNSDQITERIVWSLEHPKKLKMIAVEGRKTVLNGYTWDRSGKMLADTYERIINNYERL